jgi:hypothetical protein
LWVNATSTAVPANDFLLQQNWAKWIKLANTLKLKIYIQTKL